MTARTLRTLVFISIVAIAMSCGGDKPEESGLTADLGSLMEGEPEMPAAAEVAPENVDVLFSDDLLQVSRISLEPGESLPELETNHRVYYRPDGLDELEISVAGDAAAVVEDNGTVAYVDAGTTTLTNVGEQPMEVIEVARTDVMLPEFLATDTAEPAPTSNELLDNDAVRVDELTLDGGASAELPEVPTRLIYSPVDSVLIFESADGETIQVPAGLSEAYTRPGDDVSVTNAGEDPVTVVIFDWFV